MNRFLLVFLACGTVTLRNVSGSPVPWVVTSARLPHEVSFGSAVYDPNSGLIYILGGDFHSELVLSYNVGTEELEQNGVDGRIPPLFASAAFLSGSGEIFVLGGGNYVLSANITKYSPSGGSDAAAATTVVNQLPRPMSQMAFAYTSASQSLYMFGGFDGCYLDTILKYELPSNKVRAVGRLPEPWNGACACAVGIDGTAEPRIYIFGGNNGSVNNMDAFVVHVFNPATAELMRLGTRLPAPVYNGCAVAVGNAIYILYGITEFGVLRFSPATGLAEQLEITAAEEGTLPPFLYGPSCVYVEDMRRLYVVGGKGNFGSISYLDLDLDLKN